MTQAKLWLSGETRSRRERAIASAKDLLTTAGVAQPPINIERLARYLGVREVVTADFLDADACLVTGRSGHRIVVKDKSSKRRRRFSIAHELGHLLLSHGGISYRGAKIAERKREERLCDLIAEELLMPIELFRPRAEARLRGVTAIESLATEFDTAIESTAIRYGEFMRHELAVGFWNPRNQPVELKWSTGRLPKSLLSSRSSKDMSFGPAIAALTNEVIFTYESNAADGTLDTICESKAFGDNYSFVLTVAMQCKEEEEVATKAT